jgi:signal transduction histidine kinase/ligand-binding sensor domain-containing protein/AraC-like DNA-binding protein
MVYPMAKYFKILYLLIYLPIVLIAQYENIKFEHLTVEQGLSQNNIMCILKDKHGFMWIGTHDGLNKYDGYKFTIYRHDPDDTLSLSSNWITSLYEDRSGVLWIATKGGGINKFDREKEKFIHFKYDRNNPSGISAITVERIDEFQYGGKKVLWIGTYNGLNKMDLSNEKFTHYPHTKKGMPYSYVESMVVDSSGIVWVGSSSDGLHKFNPETEQYTHYRHDPLNPSSLSNNKIMSLFLDKSGILWIGTRGGGLNKFDQKKEQFIHYKHDPRNTKSLSSNHIWSICEDRSGILWIGSNDEGLNRFDRDTEESTHYKHDPENPYSLRTNFIRYIYQDNTDILWIGTLQGGLHKYNPQAMQFTLFRQKTSYPSSLLNTSVSSIYETDQGGKQILWIGTLSEGLYKIERETGDITNYRNDPNNSNSLSSNIVTHFIESSYDGRIELWISTFNGLNRFDPQKKQFTRYFHDPENPHSISSNIIRTIFEDKSGVFWIGTQTGGLNKFNRKTKRFSRLGPRMPVTQIYEDQSGVLWLAAWPALLKLDRETGEFTSYLRNRDASNYADLNRTNTIFESSFGEKDILWTGTFSGLNKFDRKSGQFINYSVKDGLPNNMISGILEDSHGDLWLSTNKGISRFNPRTEKFGNYDVHDGLLNSQYNFGTYFKNKDGELFFGGTNGFDAFLPDNIKDNSHIPEVVITDFQIFNEPVAINNEESVENNDVYSLPKQISLLDEIELSHRENVFSFEFAALDYHSPQKNQYAYKMEGVDPDWVHTDASRRFATYTNLDPGEYIFRVKGSNNDGLWNEEGTSIKIIITPPWWKTNLSYTFYLFLFGFVVFGVWRFQTNRLKMKHELELEHVHAKKLEEVDLLKSRFFANISHEFRTPLTLIKGPVKQMLSGDFAGNVKEQYKIILRNSDRLLQLINQLLDLSKLESGKLKLQVSKTDIIPLLKGLVFSFASLAERKKITLKFSGKQKSFIGYIDHDKIEKIIFNLLSNAFKFTPEGGVVEVVLSTEPTPNASREGSSINPLLDRGGRYVSPLEKGDKGGCLQITVTNTGRGIPTDCTDKIFDRFYQADDNYKKDSEGTGIGLALTKEFVEMCHGEIGVECKTFSNTSHIKHPPAPFSKEDSNITTFKVWLPIEKEFFKADEIIDETGDRTLETEKQMPPRAETIAVQSESSWQSPVSHLRPARQLARSPLILIVEDNPDVVQYISNFLEKDYRLISAENGSIGLKKALDKYPDLIISDVMMPEMDGFELCRKLKTDERLSHIPVILLTAKADLDSKINGLKFGADDYVIKPFEAREVQVRVKNLIEQRNKLREKFTRMIDINPVEIAATSTDEQFVKRLLDIFENHVAESDFSTEDFAREIGISRSNLHRKLQALTNQPTHEFLRSLRLKRAAQLLKKSAVSVAEVAYAVGFNNPSHFSKIFRQQFGQSPSEFANKNQ